jgi:hypothetical protein
MGTSVKIITDPVRYEPEFEGNRDKDEPMSVLIRPLTRDEEQRVERLSYRTGKGAEHVRRAVTASRDLSIKLAVSDIRGLTVVLPDGSEKPITTAEGLLEYPSALKDLLMELHTAIRSASVLSEGDEKNLHSPQASF